MKATWQRPNHQELLKERCFRRRRRAETKALKDTCPRKAPDKLRFIDSCAEMKLKWQQTCALWRTAWSCVAYTVASWEPPLGLRMGFAKAVVTS